MNNYIYLIIIIILIIILIILIISKIYNNKEYIDKSLTLNCNDYNKKLYNTNKNKFITQIDCMSNHACQWDYSQNKCNRFSI